MSADYEGSVEEVHRVFREEDYWVARLAGSGVDIATLESLKVGGESGVDDTIKVTTLQTVLSRNLPAVVTQLHRGDLCIRREESWSAVSDGVATAAVTGVILHAPVNLTGTATLCPIGDSGGSRLTVRVTIHVRVPIIGGKVERFIGSHLAELVAAEQRFTTSWITDNA